VQQKTEDLKGIRRLRNAGSKSNGAYLKTRNYVSPGKEIKKGIL